MNIPITFTPTAIAEIKLIFTKKNIPADYGLRVGIQGGGCAEVTYIIGFDKKKEKDEQYVVEDIPIYIEKRHAMFVIGVEIDYAETEEGLGFMFNK